tara:strand:- start:607 stop:771 length:165 start_codon:yes stop_codon:yes gene_type:complete
MAGTFIIKDGFFRIVQLAGLTCEDTMILDPRRVDPIEYIDCGTRAVIAFEYSAN